MNEELLGPLLAHQLFIERLIARLSNVMEFRSIGLVSEFSTLSAQIGMQELPENLIEACEEELDSIIDAIQRGRGHGR